MYFRPTRGGAYFWNLGQIDEFAAALFETLGHTVIAPQRFRDPVLNIGNMLLKIDLPDLRHLVQQWLEGGDIDGLRNVVNRVCQTEHPRDKMMVTERVMANLNIFLGQAICLKMLNTSLEEKSPKKARIQQ